MKPVSPPIPMYFLSHLDQIPSRKTLHRLCLHSRPLALSPNSRGILSNCPFCLLVLFGQKDTQKQRRNKDILLTDKSFKVMATLQWIVQEKLRTIKPQILHRQHSGNGAGTVHETYVPGIGQQKGVDVVFVERGEFFTQIIFVQEHDRDSVNYRH